MGKHGTWRKVAFEKQSESESESEGVRVSERE